MEVAASAEGNGRNLGQPARDPLRHHVRLRAGHDDHELVAAVPAGEVAAPARGLEVVADACQDLVADGVAVDVVDLLEAVHVDHDQPQGRAFAARAHQLALGVSMRCRRLYSRVSGSIVASCRSSSCRSRFSASWRARPRFRR